MRKSHVRNTIRYYLAIVVVLAFLFFTGDFGLTDVQKTAIIMAVGVDREENGEFTVSSQIAVPKSSKQGKQTETVLLVSKGQTVAEAFKEINAKTGWYPKLVFCHLIVLGESALKANAFDALDFFLINEYMTDNCLLATCNGKASELLGVDAVIDPSGSIAIQKVLSPHANRVGTVLPTTLREFSIGYYSDGKSGYLPVIKTEPQKENVPQKQGNGAKNSATSDSSSSGGGEENGADKPVFSAGETALIVGGKRVGTFTREETYAFNAVKKELQLASYTVETNGASCTLSVKHSDGKIKLEQGKSSQAVMKIEVTLTAGLLDYSTALPLLEGKDAGDVPSAVFSAAEKRLKAQILTAFEKCRNCGCDLFGVGERLQKHESARYEQLKADALKNTAPEVSVKFQNVR